MLSSNDSVNASSIIKVGAEDTSCPLPPDRSTHTCKSSRTTANASRIRYNTIYLAVGRRGIGALNSTRTRVTTTNGLTFITRSHVHTNNSIDVRHIQGDDISVRERLVLKCF